MPSARTHRTRPTVVVAVVVLLLVVVTALVALTGGSGPDPEQRQASACTALGGRVVRSSDTGGACDVPRGADVVDTVRLLADGRPDPDDARRRRADCRDAATAARGRAEAVARRRPVRAYPSVVWTTTGLCRSRTVRVVGAERTRFRQALLLARSREAATAGRGDAAVADAERADAAGSTAETRAALASARAARRRTTPTAPSGSGIVSPNEYLGLDCAAIGHAFRVAPGSDPAHDPDGDGRACDG